MELELYTAAESATDMDLFVLVQKADGNGNAMIWDADGDPYTEQPFLGFENRLRVSLRGVSETLSEPHIPVQSFAKKELLTPGEPVKIRLSIWPAGMIFEQGEQLVLRISGTDFNPAQVHGAAVKGLPLINHGKHVLYTGVKHLSKLVVPCHIEK